ncbi:ArnT family glycosyltransferase [Pedobacter nutrimenti]|uniref:4-amino-4-deoxy-L-arabinose transferase-like glycosyltransferase n=1 Tax=Pedobacter nutrimenti TaxID=1241337 RepID=A0A318U8Y0_9SPHI|nr:glycosyltransferase family 39 protein [Pedobacter nutrimenti]PYF69995.1 4-amino-4-deoxy-L-arabinose transferase-like glycosyltransferase [Pedobacter nutrimenti]
MEQSSPEKRIQWLYFFIAIAVLVNLSGLFVTIMEPDGALYASIAKNMLLRNNFSELFVEGRDWLDKPHFPFWAAAIAFKIFGVHTWSYKLPALLVMFMGTAYTYRFAKDLYTKETGLWAALILLTAQHTVISNMDVRAEPYLTGFIMAAVYHFYKGLGKGWFVQVLVGALFAACAVMTKGIFALIPVGGAIAGHLILTRQWKLLFNLRWLVAALLILVFILPELWCLYQQFDLHPEKLVFGKHGVSGVKFFFWDSQFGRFFNSGPIKKSPGDPTFFLHTILWAYLPWSFLFYIAVVQYIRKGYKKVRNVEWFNLCGAGLTFLIFSASKFQLPFYITIIFPFFSILTAGYIVQLEAGKIFTRIRVMQQAILVLMLVAVGLLQFYFRPDLSVLALLLLAGSFILIVAVWRMPSAGKFKVWMQSAAIAFFVQLYFNIAFYPKLLTYQSDSEAAFWMNVNNKENLPVVRVLNGLAYAVEFYSNDEIYHYRLGEQNKLPARPYLIYTEADVVPLLENEGIKGQVLKNFKGYHITKLKGKFLNHHTREGALTTSQVILIK